MKRQALYTLFLLTLFTAIMLVAPLHPVYANANADPTYESRATTHTVTGLTVTFPDRSYNNDFSDYALTGYGAASYGTGTYELKYFSPEKKEPRGSYISRVDFNVSYYASLSEADATYKIAFFVDPSATETVLKGPARDSGWFNITLQANAAEPNDGHWSWEDISNLRIVWSNDDGRRSDTGGMLRIVEMWITVYYTTTELYVNPQNQTLTAPTTFSITINITSVEELYGWEFKLYFDTTYIGVTGITLGPLLNNTAGAGNTWGNIIQLSNVTGLVWATQTILGDYRGASVANGSWGKLCTINFSYDSTGYSLLDLQKTKLAGYNYVTWSKKSYSITHTAYDGEVYPTAVSWIVAMEIALIPVIFYAWWKTRSKKQKTPTTSLKPKPQP